MLILYHVGLYFAPGPWIVKTPQPADWVVWPKAAVVPWRLTLLFAISGYATAAMVERSAGLASFLQERARRLLVPLLFAMLVIVPPQDWVRLAALGEGRSYLDFVTHDLLSFRQRMGVFLPNWEHLWFLPTLLAYTAILVGGIALFPGWKMRLAPAAEWLTCGYRIIAVPLALILLVLLAGRKLGLGLVAENVDYFPAFVLGFAYAHFPSIRTAFARVFPAALAIAFAALAVIWWEMAIPPAELGRGPIVAELIAEYVMSWAMMPVLFHAADRFLDVDHPLRAPLSAAVFPAYLVHQTIIVVVGWYLAQRGIVGVSALLAELVCVVAGCFLAWRLAKASPLLGTLLGMPHKPARRPDAGGVAPLEAQPSRG